MPSVQLLHEELTCSVIGAFFEVYNTLGFGFLEHLYVMAVERELRARGHEVSREVYVPVTYKGELLGRQRLDMIVDNTLVVETKSTYEWHRAATRQVYNERNGRVLDACCRAWSDQPCRLTLMVTHRAFGLPFRDRRASSRLVAHIEHRGPLAHSQFLHRRAH